MRRAADNPGRGVFVRDQVAALRRLPDLDVELFEFPPGPGAWPAAAVRLAASGRFDIVHSHFGLTAWPARAVRARARVLTLHGTDLRHPRTRRLTLAAARHIDLLATVSESLAAALPAGTEHVVLPCGVEVERFHRIPREHARRALDLDPGRPCLLFPADPRRAGKRFDRAQELAGDVALLTLGRTDPSHVPLAINAANAVIVPSDAEGFGLAVLEALACDVPVLATPVGIHAEALAGIDGTLCAPWDRDRWRAALAPHLSATEPRVQGRAAAERYSALAMAERVATAWRSLVSLA
ncbi:MAG: hypothetical protein NVSMB51_14430 [Solirubrobacteraceae bacterium]